MAHRSTTPTRHIEDKDRSIIKLRSEVRELAEKNDAIPVLQHTKRQLLESIKLLSQEMNVLSGSMRTQLQDNEDLMRVLNSERNTLEAELRSFEAMKKDAQANYDSLKSRADRCNAELQKAISVSEDFYERNEQVALETARLIRSHDSLVTDSNELAAEIDARNRGISETNLKINEVKKHIATLQTINKSMYDQIVNYEDVNNRMEDDKDQADHVQTNKIGDARRKDELVREQLARLFELEARREELRNMIQLKSNHHRQELSRQSEMTSHLSKGYGYVETSEKVLHELQRHVESEQQQTGQFLSENGKVAQANDQIVMDLEGCKTHLENLLSNNELLTTKLDSLCEEDEFIKKIITVRRRLDPPASFELSASRRTG